MTPYTQNSDAGKILLNWWRELSESDRGGRARLRRSHDLLEVQMEPAYQKLYWKLKKLPEMKSASPEQVALVAGLVAQVDDLGTTSVAKAMGTPKDGGSLPRVSELRFQRLLQVQSREELFRPLLRILRLLDRHIEIFGLANDAHFWSRETRIKWMYDYHGTH